ENPFSDESSEINFFREIKPLFDSKLIYYMKVYRFETNFPSGDSKAQKKFIKRELHEIRKTYKKYAAFYSYYRSGATHLDAKYFLRGGTDIYLMPDPVSLVLDNTFQTPYDCLLSEFLANDRFSQYLTTALEKLQSKQQYQAGNSLSGRKDLTWTASKAALYELIYALFSVGAINNGNTQLKEIAQFFAQGLNVDVGNMYRAIQEIRIRKKSRTNFIDQLKKRLEDRLDELDESPRF
ncbi:MAG: RteC domain-containing protein, partial [Chitinophagaceae bacterium]|nr:RteC domain-containing protein [Chitinophagaceae bacterium]